MANMSQSATLFYLLSVWLCFLLKCRIHFLMILPKQKNYMHLDPTKGKNLESGIKQSGTLGDIILTH